MDDLQPCPSLSTSPCWHALQGLRLELQTRSMWMLLRVVMLQPGQDTSCWLRVPQTGHTTCLSPRGVSQPFKPVSEACRSSSRMCLQSQHEAAVLAALNGERERAGQQPVARLTVGVLKEALAGKLPGGRPFRARSKKREELLADYRCGLLPVQCDAVSQQGGDVP